MNRLWSQKQTHTVFEQRNLRRRWILLSAYHTHSLTWQSGQDAGVGPGSLWVCRRVSGLQDLVEVEKLPVPAVDQILAPSFSPHLNHKPLKKKRDRTEPDLYFTLSVQTRLELFLFLNFVVNFQTHEVVDEALLLLDVSDGGADRDVVRQLIKVTEQQKQDFNQCNAAGKSHSCLNTDSIIITVLNFLTHKICFLSDHL